MITIAKRNPGPGNTFPPTPPSRSTRAARGIVLLSTLVVAQLSGAGQDPNAPEPSVSTRFSRPAYTNLGEDQKLTPLSPDGRAPDRAAWERDREVLFERWKRVLGSPGFTEYDREARVIDTLDQPEFRGTILSQSTGPDSRQEVLLLEPKHSRLLPRPGAIVPYYHPDLMAGFDLDRRERIMTRPTVQFGRHLVQQGYVVVCTEAFPYNTVPEPSENSGLGWWRAAAEKVLRDNPAWTGMGKLVHDTRRAVDLLLEQPDIDPTRILAIGHSLGGKMAFYTGCLDDRITAIIASDFGIGWSFTNWSDPWYLGDQILDADFTLAHHQLLALHAPRPFLLIAGQYDKPESWQYLNAAHPVYAMDHRETALGMIDHAAGHQPTAESIRLAYQWLAEQFALPDAAWEF